MLAYVFWHWPNELIDNGSYSDLLKNFHATLQAKAPNGFLSSIAFAVSNLPWQSAVQPGFEDWYLLEDSTALDVINQAAVSGACETPHNEVARHAAGGTAGLYRLHSGDESLAKARYAIWFSKPHGVSYQKLFADLTPITSQSGVGIWQRQMTLGPTTEFGIYSPNEIELPSTIPRGTVQLNAVWPD